MYVKSGGKFESSDWFLHGQDNLPHGPSLYHTDNHKTCIFFLKARKFKVIWFIPSDIGLLACFLEQGEIGMIHVISILPQP